MPRFGFVLAASTLCGLAATALGPVAVASSSVLPQDSRPAQPTVSDQGQIAYGKYANRGWFEQRLIVENADGTNRRTVLRDEDGNLPQFALSPDGSMLAFAYYDDVTIRAVDGEGFGTPVELPPAMSSPGAVSWSPDSTQLAFITSTSGSDERNVVIADVATLEVTLVVENSDAYTVHWSPDGNWIAYDRTSTVFGCALEDDTVFYRELMKMRPDGTDVTPLTDDRPWSWGIADWGARGILGYTTRTGDAGDISLPCDDTPQFRTDLLAPDESHNKRLKRHFDTYPSALSPDGTSYLLGECCGRNRIWRAELDGEERWARLTGNGLGSDWGDLPISPS